MSNVMTTFYGYTGSEIKGMEKEIAELKQQLLEAEAQRFSYRELLEFLVLSDSINDSSIDNEVIALLKKSPQTSITEHDAEVIEKMLEILDGSLDYMAKDALDEYAKQLRNKGEKQ